MASESKRTVLVAFAANVLIALAKLFAGVLSGSSSMLAEAAHSFADTLNQVFLLASLRESARPADREHPFGYGKARFFWSLLAAVGIFVAGAVFSVLEGVHTLLSGGETSGILIPYLVLGIAFVAEGTSWVRAVHQLRGEARAGGRSLRQHVRASKDPTVKTVLAEDTAALAGILLAAAGIGLRHLTGNSFWDGAAAVAIGLLLALVAFLLGRDTAELLIGETAEPDLVVGVHDRLCSFDEVAAVVELLTMHLGPDAVLVAARVDLNDALTGEQVEDVSERADALLRREFPEVTQVFLDATRPDPELSRRTAEHIRALRAGTEQQTPAAAAAR